MRADHAQERGNAQVASAIGAALGLGVEVGLLLSCLRGRELEADRPGLDDLAAAGFAPEGAVALWRRMEAASAQRRPTFLAIHPAPADRIAEIGAMLPALTRS